ncbi:tumor necrosis factor ligand superfamily member 14 [Pogona vitticeps]
MWASHSLECITQAAGKRQTCLLSSPFQAGATTDGSSIYCVMEAGTAYPSVFVVDAPSQRDGPFVPPVPRSQKKGQRAQVLLWILVLLMLTAVVVQGYFLISFRKELDKATVTQEAVEASYEKFAQGHSPPTGKPAAHLTLGSSVNMAMNRGLLWEYKDGSAFLQDMGYKDGSLICNKSGLYYIYSKLYLGYPSCPTTNPLLTHSICKRTSNYPKEIVLLTNNILSCNWDSHRDWRHNSFLAGIVQLEENEEVFVKVSQSQLVRVKDDSKSYFGAFMI